MTAKDKQQQQEAIQFWRESAERDRATAQSLFEQKHYDWSLFVYHLAIEKLLKGLVTQKEIDPPPVHKLVRLAELAGLQLSSEQRDWLSVVTQFNIEARYPDEKNAFYKKANHEFTALWQNRCNDLFIWLEKLITN